MITHIQETKKTPTALLSIIRIVLVIILLVLLMPSIKSYINHYALLHSLYIATVAFLFSYLLIPLVILLGINYKIVDVPDNQRKFHNSVIPLTGGVAIFVSFIVTILLNFHFSFEMKAIMVSSSMIFVTGLIDDRFGLSARLRLYIQLVAAFLVILCGVRISFVPDWLGGYVTEGIITLIWILGITNSMNFIDGMDGIASGSCIVYSFFFWLIAHLTHQPYLEFCSVILLGSCVGFFLYNFRYKKSALVFLGSSGSNFLGFLVATLAILGNWGYSIIDITVPILILSVLIYDITLTTILRIYRKEVRTFKQWLEYTGRDHFHYQLHSIGLPKSVLVGIYLILSICFGLEAVVVLLSNINISLVTLLHSIFVFVIISIILVHGNRVNTKKNEEKKL